ncbi:MAG: SDR family oxidoreductase [Acidimicrobiales bacterium]
MELSGRRALITGGASGIGLATARRLVAAGMRVALVDRDEAALEAALAELGDSARAIVADVAREEDVTAAVAHARADLGPLHLAFANAGVASGPALFAPRVAWDWVLSINVGGVVNVMNAVLPEMLERDEGHLVMTASLAGLGGVPGMGPYVASKFAVVGLAESVAHELVARGSRVGVSVLCPGFVRTQIAESDRAMAPALRAAVPVDEAARAAARAAVAAGIDPAEVADAVADAVVTGRFWILPHEHVAVRTTEQRLAWMRGGPMPGIDLARAARR